MEFLRPQTWTEALAAKTAHPDAVPICGGTDVMVELNFDRRRPELMLDLSGLSEIREWKVEEQSVSIGAGVTYAEIIRELGGCLPGLATASRTVGSPQIRNRATVAGNLGTASPAGDSHPFLLAAEATVEVASAHATRRVPIADFFAGPKQNVLAPEELIAAVELAPSAGGEQFAKIGPRNAMVIAVCSFAVRIDRRRRRVGTGFGSAGPTPLRAPAAERFLGQVLEEEDLWESSRLPAPASLKRFGELVAQAAQPIDDVRATAEYRRRALSVLATRAAGWAIAEPRP